METATFAWLCARPDGPIVCTTRWTDCGRQGTAHAGIPSCPAYVFASRATAAQPAAASAAASLLRSASQPAGQTLLLKLRAEASGLSKLASSKAAVHAFSRGGGAGGATTCRRGGPGGAPSSAELCDILLVVSGALAVTAGACFTYCKGKVPAVALQRLCDCRKRSASPAGYISVPSRFQIRVQMRLGLAAWGRACSQACMHGRAHIRCLARITCKRSGHSAGRGEAAENDGSQEAGLGPLSAVPGGGGCCGGPGSAPGAAGPAQVEGEVHSSSHAAARGAWGG